jgi:hypothetical protein
MRPGSRILRGLEGERLGGLHSRPPIVSGWFFQAACFAVTLWAMDV